MVKRNKSPAEKVNASIERRAADQARANGLFGIGVDTDIHGRPWKQLTREGGEPPPVLEEVDMPDDEEPEECVVEPPEAEYVTTAPELVKVKWVHRPGMAYDFPVEEPTVELVVDHHFEAAHRLPGYKGKCIRLHGHSYRVKVKCSGPIGEAGVVTDFSKIKATIDRLDHRYLNDFMNLPTAENTAQWLLERIPFAVEVRVWEGLGGCSAIARV